MEVRDEPTPLLATALGAQIPVVYIKIDTELRGE